MKTLVQKVFGYTINGVTNVQKAFPNSRLQEVSREVHRKLELKRAAGLTDDQKIANALAALRAKPKKDASRK